MALLPPSSRMQRPNRAATAGPIARPMRVEPVADTIATSGCPTSASPRLALTDDDVQQAVRRIAEAVEGALEDPGGGERAERRLLRWLPDHRIAADQGQGRVPGPGRDREIEGGDHAAHPHRVPGLAHGVARALRGDGQPVELARQADREVADVDHLLHLAPALLQDLAGFEGHQTAERVLGQRAAPRRAGERARRGAAPGCRARERTPPCCWRPWRRCRAASWTLSRASSVPSTGVRTTSVPPASSDPVRPFAARMSAWLIGCPLIAARYRQRNAKKPGPRRPRPGRRAWLPG